MIRVLIVDDDALVRAGLAMMLGGAEDLEIVGEILRAIRLVAAGEAMLSPTVTRKLVDFMAADGAPAVSAHALELLAELTDREREVAVAVGKGASNAEVAAELYMSVATVMAHVSRLLCKLALDNRVQVALLVHDAGLTSGAR
jgi:DNA-binding NarL/FixJ family response regulator